MCLHDKAACLYLGQDYEKSTSWTTSWSENETCGANLEPTHSLDPSPAKPTWPAKPQPICTSTRENKCFFLSQWVGVGSMQHYWDNSWLKEQSDGRNTAEDYTNHIDTNPSSNILFPHQFPINVFKNIWVALFFTSALRHSLPVRDEDSPYQMWAGKNYRFKAQTPAEKSKMGSRSQKKGIICNVISLSHNF